MDELRAMQGALHKVRVALGVQKIDLSDLPGGGTVVNFNEFTRMSEAKRDVLAGELKRQTGFATRVIAGEGDYILRIELDSGTLQAGAVKLSQLDNKMLKPALDKTASMAMAQS